MVLDIAIVLIVAVLVILIVGKRIRTVMAYRRGEQANADAVITIHHIDVERGRSASRASHHRQPGVTFSHDLNSSATLQAVVLQPRASGHSSSYSFSTRPAADRRPQGLRGLDRERSNVSSSGSRRRSLSADAAAAPAHVPEMRLFDSGEVIVAGIAEARPAEAPLVVASFAQPGHTRGRSSSSKPLPTTVAVPLATNG